MSEQNPEQSDLSADSPAGAGAGRRRGMIIGGVAVAVVAAGAVGGVAVNQFLGGGGAQPADVLPGGAVAYLRIDLDPSAAQKVAAFRLLDKLPEAKSALTAQDPKKAVFEWLQAETEDPDLKSVDYAADIEPWLGDRAGVALLPAANGASDPVPVVAVQVKDEQKAAEGIARLQSKGTNALAGAQSRTSGALRSATTKPASTETAYFFKDDFAIMTAKESEQQVKDAVAAGSLAANETFSADMEALGDAGIASVWGDQKAMMSLSPQSNLPAGMDALGEKAGRVAAALRVGSDHLEVSSLNRGSGWKIQTPAVKDITTLPADTAAVYTLGGGGEALKAVWPDLLGLARGAGVDPEAEIAKLEQQTSLQIPEDLQTLLGDQFDVVVAKQDFRNLSGPPKVGLRMWTDTGKAQGILGKIEMIVNVGLSASAGSADGSAPRLSTKVVGDHLDVALADDYLAALGTPGTLGDNEGFRRTIPDPGAQAGILFVDLDQIEDQYLDQVPQEYRDFVQGLQAVGVSNLPQKGDGEQRGTLRVSVN